MNITVTSLAKLLLYTIMHAINHAEILKCIIGLQMALLISITDSKTMRELVLPHCLTVLQERFLIVFLAAQLQSVCLLERPKGTYCFLKKNLCKTANLLWALPPEVPSLLATFKKGQVSAHSEWDSLLLWALRIYEKTSYLFHVPNVEHNISFQPGRSLRMAKLNRKVNIRIYVYTYIYIYPYTYKNFNLHVLTYDSVSFLIAYYLKLCALSSFTQ